MENRNSKSKPFIIMENMTVKQLKEICDQKGLVYKSKSTKAQLLTLLQEGVIAPKVGKSFKGEY